MAKAKAASTTNLPKESIPKSLDEHIFWGLTLDDEQKSFRDAIYDQDTKIIMCDSKAGTGKTLISVATGLLMVSFGLFDKLTYIVSVGQERHQGYLPGDENSKNLAYGGSLFDALIKLGYDPEMVVSQNMQNQKNGTDIVEFITPTYKRGINLARRFVIYDECQNAPFKDLKKMFTRIHDDSKLVAIGHCKQKDIVYRSNGFERYLNHAMDKDFCKICTLKTNHRGIISAWADELEDEDG